MSNRPFANVLAVQDEDPERLARLAANLEADSRIDRVLRPGHGWVAATTELPGGPGERTGHGLLFFEGRDVLEVHRPPDGEDPMAAAARLAAGSPERLAELPGDFGFVHFDARGTMTAVRSAAGLVPVYIYRGRWQTILSTRLGDIPSHAEGQLEIDPLVNAIWAASQTSFPDQRTFFRDVHILPAGHAVQIRVRALPKTIRYWDPRGHSGADLELSKGHAEAASLAAVENSGARSRPGRQESALAQQWGRFVVLGSARRRDPRARYIHADLLQRRRRSALTQRQVPAGSCSRDRLLAPSVRTT